MSAQTYAIRITERTLDLVTVLNSGVRPRIENEKTYFTFKVDSPNTTTEHNIVSEDELYNPNGLAKDEYKTILV